MNKMYGDHSNSQKEKMKNAYPNKEFFLIVGSDCKGRIKRFGFV